MRAGSVVVHRAGARAVFTAAAVVGGVAILSGYAFLVPVSRWPAGSVVMHLQLGASGTLIDGSAGWNDVVDRALAAWNGSGTGVVSLTSVHDSTAAIGDHNGINNVFFSRTVFGDPLGSNVLAVNTIWRTGGQRTEGDVIFNAALQWNSYRGPLRASNDLYRVTLHETGHVLGLDHPDQAGQQVLAIMNSVVSNLDSLAADDIAGARALYPVSTPAPGPGPTFPPSSTPGSPISLVGATLGSSVLLTWSAPPTGGAPTSYVIEAGSAPGLANLADFPTGATATSYSTGGVGSGVYYVRIRALNGAGIGGPSNEVVVTVNSACAGGPPAPSGLRVVSNAAGTITLAWNVAPGAISYVLEAGSDLGSANLVNTDVGSTTSLTAVNVAPGVYYVRVRAKNSCATSVPSNELVLVPAA